MTYSASLTCLILQLELLRGKCLHLHELSLTAALDCQIALHGGTNTQKCNKTLPLCALRRAISPHAAFPTFTP